jgi:glutamine synthetase type III
MALLRAPVDEAERFVERSYWPMPTYSDLLFKV